MDIPQSKHWPPHTPVMMARHGGAPWPMLAWAWKGLPGHALCCCLPTHALCSCLPKHALCCLPCNGADGWSHSLNYPLHFYLWLHSLLHCACHPPPPSLCRLNSSFLLLFGLLASFAVLAWLPCDWASFGCLASVDVLGWLLSPWHACPSSSPLYFSSPDLSPWLPPNPFTPHSKPHVCQWRNAWHVHVQVTHPSLLQLLLLFDVRLQLFKYSGKWDRRKVPMVFAYGHSFPKVPSKDAPQPWY